MPRKKRRAKLIPSVPDAERAAILAGLRQEERPGGLCLFAYWSGLFPRRDSHRWEKVRTVFQSLSHSERRAIIRRRRSGMKGRMWIDRETGRVRVHGDIPTYKPDANDPRRVLGHGLNAGAA